MNDDLKEMLEEIKTGLETGRDKDNIRVDGLCYHWSNLKMLLDYITNLQEKYEEADSDRHKLFEQKEKAVEELELWKPKNKVIQLEIELLLNILRGNDK